MRDQVTRPTFRSALVAAAVGAVALGAASSAEAGEGNGKKYRGSYAPAYVVVPQGYAYAPIVYAPRPVVVYPAPVMMYAPAYPVYAAPYPPVGSLNLGISLPLR